MPDGRDHPNKNGQILTKTDTREVMYELRARPQLVPRFESDLPTRPQGIDGRELHDRPGLAGWAEETPKPCDSLKTSSHRIAPGAWALSTRMENFFFRKRETGS